MFLYDEKRKAVVMREAYSLGGSLKFEIRLVRSDSGYGHRGRYSRYRQGSNVRGREIVRNLRPREIAHHARITGRYVRGISSYPQLGALRSLVKQRDCATPAALTPVHMVADT